MTKWYDNVTDVYITGKDFNIEYNVWQASKTVSANGRVISLTSMPYNKDIGANELYKIVMVVSGQVLHQLSVERSRLSFTKSFTFKFLKFFEVI